MEKTVHPSSNFALKKCNKTLSHLHEDQISKLPDDILVSILCLLNLKEATRTSVLSRRWRHLWTFTGTLDFDDSLMVLDMFVRNVEKSLEVEKFRFVNWVNQVIKSHKGAIIEEFRVCFDVDEKRFKCDIDNWIKFALQKRVQKLELDFRSYEQCFQWCNYTITTQFLSHYSLGSITALLLNYMEVTSEVVEYILFNCPCLEMLSLSFSNALPHLKVSGKSLKLKYLEIIRCCNLEYIEISETNLVSLTYFGFTTRISVNNVPSLVEAYFTGSYACFCINNFCQVSYLSQLKTLALNVGKRFDSFPEFSKLKNLKRLELTLDAMGLESILFCLSLVDASPSLQRFSLKVSGLETYQQQYLLKKKEDNCPHQCPKVVELVGFVGCSVDVEVALCLLEKAVSLEKLIIDPCSLYILERRLECENLEMKLAAITRAKQLETSLPPGAELVIL